MQIIKNVTVKQVLTEKSKATLLRKFEENRLQLEKEKEQLRFEAKKLEKTKKFHPVSLRSELKEGEVQALVDIEVGDNWEEIVKDREIIIKDGTVIEIR